VHQLVVLTVIEEGLILQIREFDPDEPLWFPERNASLGQL